MIGKEIRNIFMETDDANENFVKYFADIELPVMKKGSTRSSCLSGRKLLCAEKDYRRIPASGMLEKHLGKRDTGLFLDLAAYSIISENNAAQYYPDYAYNHPLFKQKECIYIVIQGSQISFPG